MLHLWYRCFKLVIQFSYFVVFYNAHPFTEAGFNQLKQLSDDIFIAGGQGINWNDVSQTYFPAGWFGVNG